MKSYDLENGGFGHSTKGENVSIRDRTNPVGHLMEKNKTKNRLKICKFAHKKSKRSSICEKISDYNTSIVNCAN